MKSIIKISLIALVIIGIIITIVLFANGIDGKKGDIIPRSSFEKLVQDRTNEEIKGKDYPEAKKAFASIMQEIKTEASITLNDGSKNLTDEEVDRANKIVYYEFAPIFTEYGISYFTKSSWDDTVLKGLRTEASILINEGIAEPGTPVLTDLRSIATTVDEYYAAWNVARSAEHCSTVGAIATLKNSASRYKHSPLTNNASLLAALNSVETNAKNSVIRIITSHCNGVASKCRSYSDYVSWTDAYDRACKTIEEYKSSYGYPQELKNVRAKLDEADSDALSYYSN